MIDQLVVFLENKKGRLAALCRTIGDADINMYALSVNENTEYGTVRIICNAPERALAALEEAGYRALTTKILAVSPEHRPGGAAELLSALDVLNLNIDYAYCFSHKDTTAMMALKFTDEAKMEQATNTLNSLGFRVFEQDDLSR